MINFWQEVRALAGERIPTVTGRSAFVISDITDRDLTVTLGSTGNSRRIERFKFEDAFQAGKGSPIQPDDVRRLGLSVVHTSYVAAVVNAVIGRQGKAKPR
jgi:hypothetical protein